MDPVHFDTLAKTLAAAGTRRGLVRLLTILPVAGALLAGLDQASGAARRGNRRHEAQRQRVRDEGKGKDKRKKRRKKSNRARSCAPESAAQTCAGRCGTVANNCGTPVNCGSCSCSPACPACERCNVGTGRCEPNPAFLGQVCAAPGQVCQADGRCVCDSGSCAAGQRCNELACVCDEISCSSGCCDGATCRIDDDNACGTGGGTCTRCTSCQVCNGAGQCEADLDQNRTSCQLAGGGLGVCCSGTCCAGCCDANNTCGACLAFLASASRSTGNLGGLTGADAKCQARAGAWALPGTYKAWLSNANQSPATRFRCRRASCSTEGYKRVDGVTIADDWDDLTTCDAPNGDCLHAAIFVTEGHLEIGDVVWTNTATNGTVRSDLPNDHCEGWSNGTIAVSGNGGSSSFANSGWTAFNEGSGCDNLRALYCFQQS